MNINIRDMVEEDRSFIFATWLLGLRHGNELYKEIKKESYFSKYKQVIELLLSRSTVKVACLIDDPDVVLGYVVYQGDKLHWVFVKKAWRKLSIASQLVPKNIKYYSHITKMIRSFKPQGWEFDPFL